MARRTLSVSISVPRWMDDKIANEAEKHGVSYSAYLREIVRDHEDTPFDVPTEPVVCRDGNCEEDYQEGAA